MPLPRTLIALALVLPALAVAGCVTHVDPPAPRQASTPAVVVAPSGPAAMTSPAATGDTATARVIPRAPFRFYADGFVVYEDDGRLWVFEDGSEALDTYRAKGEPAKRVTKIGVGPEGMTVMSDRAEVIDAYVAAMGVTPSAMETMPAAEGSGGPARSTALEQPGFVVFEEDGRLWVFEDGSAALSQFLEKGEPAKRVTKLGVGPGGRTVMSDSGETIDAYVAAMPSPYAKPGFVVLEEDGRLWIFREGSEAYAEFLEKGEPAKRVTKVGAGPDGKTVMGPDTETLDAYLGR